MTHKKTRVAAAVAAVLIPGAVVAAEDAEASKTLDEVVVTMPRMVDPFTVVTDPQEPYQPVPASDGASYLKNIPGFAVSRKGGTDGDPALRGLGGSRLNILLDDSFILGGCGQRMDPPTAYIYPESYDRVTVLKGPQSVRYGASVAGTVRFERETERFTESGVRGSGSLLFGSFGRNDQRFDIAGGNPDGYLRAIGTRSDSDNYEDGDGEEVHSFYTRWSGTALAGWTPDEDTRLEFSYDASDGEAAYADRSMDGAEFDREGYAVEFSKENLSETVAAVEAKVYRNYIDHVMDNFSLRDPGMMYRVMNPDRETIGGRVEAELALTDATRAMVGLDHTENEHTSRMAMAMGSEPTLGDRNDKASFEKTGLFAEFEHSVNWNDRLLAGARVDESEAEAEQQGMGGYGGVAAGTTDEDTNLSGFARWEHDLADRPDTVYVGLGRAERSPDFWERDRVFDLDTEKETQLDVGWSHRGGALEATVALFYADIADYILIFDDNNDPTDGADGARNVDATTYGGEVDLTYTFSPSWSASAAMAYVHGENDTDGTALAQMPPLEGTLAVNYDDGRYSAGINLRAVDRQDRVDEGSGTIYGLDIGETPGFAVLSLNGGYRTADGLKLTAGIDNLLDKTYAEHLARGGADLGVATDRVNEPGRSVWVKVSARF